MRAIDCYVFSICSLNLHGDYRLFFSLMVVVNVLDHSAVDGEGDPS